MIGYLPVRTWREGALAPGADLYAVDLSAPLLARGGELEDGETELHMASIRFSEVKLLISD